MGEHTDTGFKPTPAIWRTIEDTDNPTRVPKTVGGQLDFKSVDKIISQPKDTVTHSRGWGDSGYRIQVVKHDCPECSFDRMVRRVDISPETETEVRYWCLNPNCAHYAGEHLSHACHGNYPQRQVSEPAVFESGDA